jgi:hypothetical protein
MLLFFLLVLLFEPSFKDTQGVVVRGCSSLCSGSLAAIPDHGVKGLAGDESAAQIEIDGVGILPRNRECERLKTGSAQRA